MPHGAARPLRRHLRPGPQRPPRHRARRARRAASADIRLLPAADPPHRAAARRRRRQRARRCSTWRSPASRGCCVDRRELRARAAAPTASTRCASCAPSSARTHRSPAGRRRQLRRPADLEALARAVRRSAHFVVAERPGSPLDARIAAGAGRGAARAAGPTSPRICAPAPGRPGAAPAPAAAARNRPPTSAARIAAGRPWRAPGAGGGRRLHRRQRPVRATPARVIGPRSAPL